MASYERVRATCIKCGSRWWVPPERTHFFLCLGCLVCWFCGKTVRWVGLMGDPGSSLRCDFQLVSCPEHTKDMPPAT